MGKDCAAIRRCISFRRRSHVQTEHNESIMPHRPMLSLMHGLFTTGSIWSTVLEKLKPLRLECKSIITTVYPSAELAAGAMKLGVVDYLIKPIIPDDLERLTR